MDHKNDITLGLERDARLVKERILMGQEFEKAKEAASRLAVFIEEQGWTQAAVANKLGVSPAVINQFLQNKYEGKHEDLINKVVNLIESIARKNRRPRNDKFIDTTIAKQIGSLISQTEMFSDDEGKIGIIIGDAGHGKSHCLREYAKANKNTVYVELDQAMTPTLVFAEIADKVKVYSAGSLATVTRRLIEHLQNRHITIMIDEASHLRVKQLDQLRQVICVKAKRPLILAGNADLFKTIMQQSSKHGYESLDQFTSRLVRILNLDELAATGGEGGLYTAEDIRKLYEYGGIRLTKDAVATLRKMCITSRTGRLRTCGHIIAALHTSGVVAKTGQIDSQMIIAAIEQLRLPVADRLPLAIRSPDEEEEKQAETKAKTA